jgi:hypothetical protein
MGPPITGAVADIYKCFDQILRDLLKVQLEVGGMPRRISEPYLRFMDSLKVRNSLAGALGAPYQLETGIPQGCPLSLMMIAYLLRPWIMKMRSMQVTPRVLADDILLFARGEGHETRFKQAYDATHAYINDMGASMAPSKSATFSTDRKTRQRLRMHTWHEVGQKIKVVNHNRDLG